MSPKSYTKNERIKIRLILVIKTNLEEEPNTLKEPVERSKGGQKHSVPKNTVVRVSKDSFPCTERVSENVEVGDIVTYCFVTLRIIYN